MISDHRALNVATMADAEMLGKKPSFMRRFDDFPGAHVPFRRRHSAMSNDVGTSPYS
jgi:hypothetical protein